MTFEEDFPSLKGKALQEIGKVKKVSIINDKLFFDYELNLPFFSTETIMAVCLDKSKVKQAIKDYRLLVRQTAEPLQTELRRLNLLEKELGLEE